MKNTFYQQILSALDQPLNDKLFEHCAVNLLEPDFPGISPILGGNDSGMDGGVFDGDGTPYPLVTTTAKDYSGNLKRNLSEYVKKGGKRRKAIFATSRPLTADQRKYLRKVSEELGFQLVQDFERTAIADRLYRNPFWCKELLGLIGTPEALTTVPSGARRLLGEKIIGQSSVIESIETAETDMVLVGPPGSGKTFALYHVARNGGGLFVEATNLVEITNAIREYQPKRLFVDDAISKRELVRSLRRIKSELNAEYKIVACGWTSHCDQLCDDLDLQPTGAFQVERLTRDEIVEVIHDTGIRHPTGLVNEIVWQADGLPGLAVALCSAALCGNVDGISSADSLAKFLVNRLSNGVDKRSQKVLAVIALTGDVGTSLNQISTALQIPAVEIQEIATGLALGGVLHEVSQTNLVVRPLRLRGALIRDVFFNGALSLDLTAILPHIDQRRLADELIQAKHLGAEVPNDLLRHVLSAHRPSPSQYCDTDPWKSYAYLGVDESRFLLEQLGNDLSEYSEPFLRYVPHETICRMLNAAVGDHRTLHSSPSHPIRKLKEWIKDAKPGTKDAISRRQKLIESAIDWIDSGGTPNEFCMAVEAAFTPACEWQENKPGSGLAVTVFASCLGKEQVQELFSHWKKIYSSLERRRQLSWQPLLSVVHLWTYPAIINCKIDDATYKTIRRFAEQMIRDFAILSRNNPGVQQRLKEYAQELGAEIEFELDARFEVLFPPDDALRDQEFAKKCFRDAEALANKHAADSPVELARFLKNAERERDLADIRGVAFISTFCNKLSAQTDDPFELAQALLNEHVSPECLWPFLARLLESKPTGWCELTKELFSQEAYRTVATVSVLQDGSATELIPTAIDIAPDALRPIETCVLRGEINENIVSQLLNHDDSALAAAVAWGLWHCDPEKTVPPQLFESWKKAVVGSYACERWPHELNDIFEAYPDLAFQWIEKFTTDKEKSRRYSRSERAGELSSFLTLDQRSRILEMTSEDSPGGWIIDHIVNGDRDLYKQVLARADLARLHLRPLTHFNTSSWPGLVEEALQSGCNPKHIAQSAFQMSGFWSGNESDMHRRRIQELNLIETDKKPALKELIDMMLDWEQSDFDRCVAQERREAVFGER